MLNRMKLPRFIKSLSNLIDDVNPTAPETTSKPNSRSGNMNGMSRQQSRGSQVSMLASNHFSLYRLELSVSIFM